MTQVKPFPSPRGYNGSVDKDTVSEDQRRMIRTRKIVKIDEDKCDGCGLCVPECAEGAIRIVDGKARLVGEDLCDGLGNCLGTCPEGAISIEERPAEEFDEAAVAARRGAVEAAVEDGGDEALPCGCPGTMMRRLERPRPGDGAQPATPAAPRASRLGQWPVQLALLPASGEIWRDAEVLLSADCVAYAMGDIHDRLLAGRTVAVACPKLDDVEPYAAKLAAVFANNSVKRVIVARMEVPCCAGLVTVVQEAMKRAGKHVRLDVVTVGIDGGIQAVNGVTVA